MTKGNWEALIVIGIIIFFGWLIFFSNRQSYPPPPTPSPTSIYFPTPIPTASSSPQSNCITPQEAYNEYGATTCVEYYVGYATTSRNGNVFLDQSSNYTQGFTVTIYSNNVSKFNNPTVDYDNKTIDVTGTIAQYQGHPEIIVSDPFQITVR